MAKSFLTSCAFAFVFAHADASGLLLRQGGRALVRARAFAGLRYSPQDPAARTLLALDTNHDGRIDPDEIATFAHSQGLDAEAATQEFSSIDANGDGVLDSTELQKVLGVSPAAKLGSADEASRAVSASPSAAAAFSYDGEISAAAEDTPTPKAKDGESSTVHAPKTVLISDESRTSVRMAAQKVAEDLALEEKEEDEARTLDRKAAELRMSSSTLSKLTMQNALSVAATAAHTKAKELLATVTKLEDEAQKAEVRAVALRAKSKLEMEQGSELMKVADQALTRTS